MFVTPCRIAAALVLLAALGTTTAFQGIGFRLAGLDSRQSARRSFGLQPRCPMRILKSAETSSVMQKSDISPKDSPESRKLGPHIRVGKKGIILNMWGLWIMTYSVFIALFGYAYLEIRFLLGYLTFGLLKPKAEHCCWIMHAWCRLILWLGCSNPKVLGLDNLPSKDETILVAANHLSWFDVPVLSGYLGGRSIWSFAKAELVKVPILGTYMRAAEHIMVSRDSRKSQMESLKAAIATIKQKRSVFIFPEGTRSMDGNLRPFKGGAFTIARKTGARIVPVTLIGNDEVFPADALMPVRPGRGLMRMVIHPPIDPAGRTDEELLELTRAAIASALPGAAAAAAPVAAAPAENAAASL